MAIWMASAAGAQEARLRGTVNVSDVLINPLTNNEPTLLIKALTKRCAIGSSTWHSDDADIKRIFLLIDRFDVPCSLSNAWGSLD